MLYRKKPAVVEAVEFDGSEASIKRLQEFVDAKALVHNPQNGNLAIETLEGQMKISVGDFVIKGVVGEFYPCKGNVFREVYEAITEGK